MGFWKYPPFLVLSILVLYQAGFLLAAPIRADLESRPYPASLPEEDRRLLLIELVKAYMQMKASEMEQERETRESSVTAQKRACYTATCLTHHLAGWLSSAKNRPRNNNLLPMNMGFRPNGRRRMNFRN